MAVNILEHLKSLHTSAIDARNGYREALKDAEGNGMTPLFRVMTTLHDRHAAELARELTKRNELADDEGSFMSVVHKTIMDMRSLFDGLNESVLPGLIDGEKRNAARYDEALKATDMPPHVTGLLTRQLDDLAKKIAFMETERAAAEQAA
ncbi:MAG: DUF2383 domain-containing protein [Bradyrhizobium sp.]